MRSELSVVLIATLLSVVGCAGESAAPAPSQEAVKVAALTDTHPPTSSPALEPAPDFQLVLFNSDNLRLSDLKGKIVVLNFWGSWCPPCRKEMPEFEGLWRDYRDQGVVFLGVAVSDGEKDAIAFADEMGVTYPLGLDTTGGEILIDYSALMMPATFVIDRLGYEAKKYYLVSESTLRAALIDQLETQ